jgi:hypothetical protein
MVTRFSRGNLGGSLHFVTLLSFVMPRVNSEYTFAITAKRSGQVQICVG